MAPRLRQHDRRGEAVGAGADNDRIGRCHDFKGAGDDQGCRCTLTIIQRPRRFSSVNVSTPSTVLTRPLVDDPTPHAGIDHGAPPAGQHVDVFTIDLHELSTALANSAAMDFCIAGVSSCTACTALTSPDAYAAW